MFGFYIERYEMRLR